MRRKILVCGSSGFLMSNFMRYMIYRTKEYSFCSIDPLERLKDFDFVYQNRRHGFHIGDTRDSAFVKKVAHVEKPDFVVSDLRFTRPPDTVAAVCALQEAFDARSIIHVFPAPHAEVQKASMRAAAAAMRPESTRLHLKRCFGLRDRFGEFAIGLKRRFEGENSPQVEQGSTKQESQWCYAEDVASMIWYLIENPPPEGREVSMPSLGRACLGDMLRTAMDELGMGDFRPEFGSPETDSDNGGWQPDSSSLEAAVRKVAQWYDRNRWMLPLVGESKEEQR